MPDIKIPAGLSVDEEIRYRNLLANDDDLEPWVAAILCKDDTVPELQKVALQADADDSKINGADVVNALAGAVNRIDKNKAETIAVDQALATLTRDANKEFGRVHTRIDNLPVNVAVTASGSDMTVPKRVWIVTGMVFVVVFLLNLWRSAQYAGVTYDLKSKPTGVFNGSAHSGFWNSFWYAFVVALAVLVVQLVLLFLKPSKAKDSKPAKPKKPGVWSKMTAKVKSFSDNRKAKKAAKKKAKANRPSPFRDAAKAYQAGRQQAKESKPAPTNRTGSHKASADIDQTLVGSTRLYTHQH